MKLPCIDTQVAETLREDLGSGDISSLLIDPNRFIQAVITCRESAIICGIPWVNSVFDQLDKQVQLSWLMTEGDRVQPNQPLVELSGPARSILSGERCALNWLQTLSGTATQVSLFLEQLIGFKTQLLDTRKTIPGLRTAQKYAVRCAGGKNHRMGLFDAYLIKENHIHSCGSIGQAVCLARQLHPDKKVEVEVESLTQLDEALACQTDIIMLDNFQLPEIRIAVEITSGRAKLEVSGNVTLGNIREIAETGIDFISVGALTKHLRAIDLSLRFI